MAPSADRVALLSSRPTECLRASPGDGDAWEIEVGRAAFRTPLLLGGRAARVGLSCEACHTNGRANASFFFPGLSGAPGTADVTTSLLSSHREDGVENPRPVPDLSREKARLKVSQAPASPQLAAFIHSLITEEFDGAEPPAAVLRGLAAYVRTLRPASCPARASEAMSVGQPVSDARRAIDAALGALDGGDAATATLMIEAARHQLSLIDERYAALPADREVVRLAALDLAAALADVRQGRAPTARLGLIAWRARTPAWSAVLRRDEARSLYNPAVLGAALAG